MLIRVLAEKIRGLAPPADISGIMRPVEDLFDSSIETASDNRPPTARCGTICCI